MSFDIFDYAPTVVELQTLLTSSNSCISSLQQQKNEILALPDDQRALLQSTLDDLTRMIAEETTAIARYNDILARITDLNALSSQQKSDLYTIYVFSGEPISIFAMRQLWYHSQLIANALPIINNGVLSADMKRQLVFAVLQNCSECIMPSYYHWTPPASSVPIVPAL